MPANLRKKQKIGKQATAAEFELLFYYRYAEPYAIYPPQYTPDLKFTA